MRHQRLRNDCCCSCNSLAVVDDDVGAVVGVAVVVVVTAAVVVVRWREITNVAILMQSPGSMVQQMDKVVVARMKGVRCAIVNQMRHTP